MFSLSSCSEDELLKKIEITVFKDLLLFSLEKAINKNESNNTLNKTSVNVSLRIVNAFGISPDLLPKTVIKFKRL